MRGISLAPRAASPALKETISHSIHSFSPFSNFNSERQSAIDTSGGDPSSGNVHFSTSIARHSHETDKNQHNKPVDRSYISRVLSRKDWSLLLNHELRAKRILLNSQFTVSVMQNLENPLMALRYYLWVSSVDPQFAKNQSVRGALANSFYRKGPVLLSVELLTDIKDSGFHVNEDLVCVLFASWGRLGLAKYCNEVFGQISFLGISSSTRLYNAVIDALVKANSLDLAYLKFQQMASDSCKPDRFTYNILIHGVCRVGVMDEALRLAKQMEAQGYFPNVFTYTILVDGFCNANRIDEAFGVFETMKARNVHPNEATIRSLVHGVFRTLTPVKAFELMIAFIDRESILRKLACDTLLGCLSDNSMAIEAGTLLRKLGDTGYVPDTSAFNTTMTCLIKGLDLSETCKILDTFAGRGMKLGINNYIALVEGLYREGKCEEAERYFQQMANEGLLTSAVSYNRVIDCFCKVNKIDKADNAFKEMQQKGITPNLVTLNTLLSGYCKNGEVHGARKLLEMLLERGFKPDIFTFTTIIDGLCRAKHLDDALGCFREMVEWGVSPNSVTYSILLRSLGVNGDVAGSMQILRKMERDGIDPDVFAFNTLIQSFCRMGKVKEAQNLLASMLALKLVPDNHTYGALVKTLCELRRSSEAKELFDSMEANGCPPDSLTCNLIVDNLLQQGHYVEADNVTKVYKAKGLEVKSINTE
ncbi:Putative pentatricopeptide repeat-containing protein At3g16890, mitochondrial [Linum perenne]